jgi:hypothetical protein
VLVYYHPLTPRVNLVQQLAEQTVQEILSHKDVFSYLQKIAHVIINDNFVTIIATPDINVIVMKNNDFEFAKQAIANIKMRHFYQYHNCSDSIKEIYEQETNLFVNILEQGLQLHWIKIR